jgi:hypothetical protein
VKGDRKSAVLHLAQSISGRARHWRSFAEIMEPHDPAFQWRLAAARAIGEDAGTLALTLIPRRDPTIHHQGSV